MPYSRSTINEIINRIEANIESRMPGSDAKLRNSIINAIVKSVAAEAHGLYGNLDYLSKQLHPYTATDEYLDFHANWWKIYRNAAVGSIGNVDFIGTDGVVIPAGTTLQRSDATEFKTDVDVTIVAGIATVAVTAVVAGQGGNTAAASTLTLSSPITGVTSEATVDANGLTGGTDIETDDALRDRLRERIQRTPQGGAEVDYHKWAKEISGVTRTWVFPQWLGVGTVGVFFVRDDDASSIPDASEVTTVQDYIDSVRPVTADVTLIAPTEAAQAMTIQLSPNDADTQTSVEASLKDMLRREANVEDGTGSGEILLSHIREAISIATGEDDHVLVSPVADITPNTGELVTLGAITWQAIP